MTESDRSVPAELTQTGTTEFTVPGSKITFRFNVDGGGRGIAVVGSFEPEITWRRTGDPVRHLFHDYQRSEALIPMRDGVKLNVVILKPADIAAPLPFLIQRTPYGVDATTRAWFFRMRPELARAGYIYVGEDIRGRFKSEGQFVMSRPLADHKDPKAIDESTDAWDTVDWLLKNVAANNGRAGFIGTSYPG
ncbi:MAG TPA: CocE/NonD family hydrolase, partial [Candidatus Solibacter sp.]